MRPIQSPNMNELYSGERQVGATFAEIESGHLNRYRWARDHLLVGSKVADFGCGVGYGAGGILVEVAAEVLCVDISAAAIEYAKKNWNGPNVRFIHSDLITVDVEDGSLDAVILLEVIEHVKDPKPLLKRIISILKPGGKLLLSSPNKDLWPLGEHEFHEQHYSPSELKTLLGDFGLSTESISGQTEGGIIKDSPNQFILLESQLPGRSKWSKKEKLKRINNVAENNRYLLSVAERTHGFTPFLKQNYVDQIITLREALLDLKSQRDKYNDIQNNERDKYQALREAFEDMKQQRDAMNLGQKKEREKYALLYESFGDIKNQRDQFLSMHQKEQNKYQALREAFEDMKQQRDAMNLGQKKEREKYALLCESFGDIKNQRDQFSSMHQKEQNKYQALREAFEDMKQQRDAMNLEQKKERDKYALLYESFGDIKNQHDQFLSMHQKEHNKYQVLYKSFQNMKKQRNKYNELQQKESLACQSLIAEVDNLKHEREQHLQQKTADLNKMESIRAENLRLIENIKKRDYELEIYTANLRGEFAILWSEISSAIDKLKNAEKINTYLNSKILKEANKHHFLKVEYDSLIQSKYVKSTLILRTLLGKIFKTRYNNTQKIIAKDKEFVLNKNRSKEITIAESVDLSRMKAMLKLIDQALAGLEDGSNCRKTNNSISNDIGKYLSIIFVTANLQSFGGNKVKVELMRNLARRGHTIRLVVGEQQYRENKFGELPGEIYYKLDECPKSDYIVASHWGSLRKIIPFGESKGRPIHLVQGDEPELIPNGHPNKQLAIDAFSHDLFRRIIISDYMEEFSEKYEQNIVGRINNGVNTKAFYPLIKDQNKKQICFINREGKSKGVQHIIDALGMLSKKYNDMSVVSFGFAKDLSGFRIYGKEDASREAHEYGPTPHIEYFCQPDEETRAKIYRESMIYISASMKEGSPLSILEALASGACVVSTPTGVDYAVDCQDMMFIDYRNPYSIVDAVSKIFDDEVLFRRIRTAGIKIATKRTWLNEAKEFEAVLLDQQEKDFSETRSLTSLKLKDFIATEYDKQAIVVCWDWNISRRFLNIVDSFKKAKIRPNFFYYRSNAKKEFEGIDVDSSSLMEMIEERHRHQAREWINHESTPLGKDILDKPRMFRGYDIAYICKFEILANEKIGEGGREWSDPLILIEEACSLLIALEESVDWGAYDTLYLWNGERFFYKAVQCVAAKHAIKTVYLERGHFPNTIIVDRIGIGKFNEMKCILWPSRNSFPMTKNKKDKIKRFLNEYIKSGATLEKQNNRKGIEELRVRFGVSSQDLVLFVPLQVPIDTNMLCRMRCYSSNEELLKSVIEASSKIKANIRVIAKKHPGDLWSDITSIKDQSFSSTNVKVDVINEVNVHDLINIADVVITLNSQVGIEALAYNKPVVVCADATYDGMGITYDVEKRDELKDALVHALKGPAGSEEERLHYLYLLTQEYLQPDDRPVLP